MADDVLLIVIGLLAGVMSGLFGIGGGVVIVPILVTFLEFTQLEANATSLAARLVPVGIFAVLAYHRAGKLLLTTAALLALGKVGGSLVGSEIALSLPEENLQRLYGVFLLYVSWRFIDPLQYLRRGAAAAAPAANPDSKAAHIAPAWPLMLLLGLVAGVSSGLFGIGGGIVMVPVLVTLFGIEQKLAVGTSLAAIQFPADFPAVLNYHNNGNLIISAAIFVGFGLIFGSFAGARIALSLPNETIKRLYGLFLLVTGLRFLLQL